MNVDLAMDVAREAMMQTLILAGPMLLVALVVGAIVGLMQAVTQIQDPTISLVPKIVAVFLALAVCLPWLLGRMLEFSERLFGTVPSFLAGG